jgi:tetraacyldisaccharide-1-P 4'-kinase
VVDGAVQLRPQRADLALLAVDAAAPWGAGAVPPAGDLRAPVAVLRRAADAVVAVGAVGPVGPVGPVGEDTPEAASAGEPAAHAVMPGVEVAGALLPWASVRALRLGLVTALARPDRIVRSLAHHGVTPQVVVSAADHGPARAVHRGAVAAARGIDLWVATRKCAVTFAPLLGGALATLAYTVVPNPALRALCLTRCGPFASPPRAERTPRPRP